jgi:general secretion pathway protein C
MDVLFKKYFWALNLLALAAGGYLVGSTVNDYLVAKVLRGPTGTLIAPSTGEVKVQPDKMAEEPIGEILASRRPFNSDPPVEEAPPAPPVETPAEEPEKQAETSGEMEESALDVSLVGTLVYPDPSMSMATVKLANASKLVRVGTELEGKAKIVRIERRYLVVEEEGKTKVIRLWGEKKAAGAAGATGPGGRPAVPQQPMPSNPATPPPANAAAPDWKEGVTKVSETEYQISRSMLDEQLQDLSQLGMQARIVPNYRNGKYEGFKLVGVRPNSLYRAIGIRSGDIIKRINGAEINSPNKAIELFEQFKASNNIAMDVERRGQVQTFQYTVK